MEEQYVKEQLIIDRKELEKESELIRNIIKTREELKHNHNNFEYAENDLIDFYIYEIKANQAKLNHLIKLAKTRGLSIDAISQLKYENYQEEIG